MLVLSTIILWLIRFENDWFYQKLRWEKRIKSKLDKRDNFVIPTKSISELFVLFFHTLRTRRARLRGLYTVFDEPPSSSRSVLDPS